MAYKFRQDDGTIVEVDFETMMTSKDGFIEIDGEILRRVHEGDISRKAEKEVRTGPVTTVSSALGCIDTAVGDWRQDAETHGFGVEWKPDPMEPRFYNAYFSSEKERLRYVSHRQFYDKNPHSGHSIDKSMLRKAEERVRDMH